MNDATQTKKAVLILASALLAALLCGCSDSGGGSVSYTPGNATVPSTVKSESGVQIPSADSLGTNGELIQSAAITEEDVLRSGFAVQQEIVKLQALSGCVSQITTSAYVSTALLNTPALEMAEASDELGSSQTAAVLDVVQGEVTDAVNDMAAAVSEDIIIPVTLTYNYIPRLTASSSLTSNSQYVPSLQTFTVQSGSDYPGASFCVTYTAKDQTWASADSASWALDDSTIAGQIIQLLLGADDVEALSDAALADVADLVSEYGYTTLPNYDNTGRTIRALDESWTITQSNYRTGVPPYRLVALQRNTTPASSSGTFVYCDSKKVDLDDPNVPLVLSRTLRTWLPNGAAAQIELLYVYNKGALYGVKVSAMRSEDASFTFNEQHSFNGGVDAFLVDANGNLVRTDDASTIYDYPYIPTAANSLSGSEVTASADVPVYSMYWATLLGEDSPSDADIIEYLRQSEASALEDLQNADTFLTKVQSGSQ
jgi:hypothetical protein